MAKGARVVEEIDGTIEVTSVTDGGYEVSGSRKEAVPRSVGTSKDKR